MSGGPNIMAVCEAFIMTGQKMLKLSCDESGQTNNKIQQHNNNLNSKFRLKVVHQNNNSQAGDINENKFNDIDNQVDNHLIDEKKFDVTRIEVENRSDLDTNHLDDTTKESSIINEDPILEDLCSKALLQNGLDKQIEEAREKHTGTIENNNYTNNIESIDKELEQQQQQEQEKLQEEEVVSERIDKGLIDKEHETEVQDKEEENKPSSLVEELLRKDSPRLIRKLPNNLNSKKDLTNKTLNMANKSQSKQASKKDEDNKDDALITFKAGYLNRKRTCDPGGKPTARGRRSWRRVYVVLQDLRIKMRNGIHEDDIIDETVAGDVKNDANNDVNKPKEIVNPDDRPIKTKTDDIKPPTKNKIAPEKTKTGSTLAFDIKSTSKIHHSLASPSSTYEKRDFVFHLRLADRSEYLLQANNEQDMKSWIESINFASACLSAPALPKAVVNDNKELSPKSKQQRNMSQILHGRPILPASYTKLSYWEQLENHEERLRSLKQELDQLLAEAPSTRNAKKRLKTQFLDRIANLKEDIERYEIYVSLMQKKSNSPEAMILSKHAKIVPSLTPSDEMMKYVPLK